MYLKSWKVHIGTYYYLLTSQKYVTVIQKEIVTFGSICLRQCGMQLGRKWFTGSFSWLTRYLASSSGFHEILFNRMLKLLPSLSNSWGQWWECQARSKRRQIVQSKMYFMGLLDLVQWIYSSLALFLSRETTLSNLSSSNITQSTRSMSQHFFKK